MTQTDEFNSHNQRVFHKARTFHVLSATTPIPTPTSTLSSTPQQHQSPSEASSSDEKDWSDEEASFSSSGRGSRSPSLQGTPERVPSPPRQPRSPLPRVVEAPPPALVREISVQDKLRRFRHRGKTAVSPIDGLQGTMWHWDLSERLLLVWDKVKQLSLFCLLIGRSTNCFINPFRAQILMYH